MSDFQDHYYPSEMAVDAQIQTFLMKKIQKHFLKIRYRLGKIQS